MISDGKVHLLHVYFSQFIYPPFASPDYTPHLSYLPFVYNLSNSIIVKYLFISPSPVCSPGVPAGCWYPQCQGAHGRAVLVAKGQPLSCAGQILSLPSCPVVCLRGVRNVSHPLPHAGEWKELGYVTMKNSPKLWDPETENKSSERCSHTKNKSICDWNTGTRSVVENKDTHCLRWNYDELLLICAQKYKCSII